MNFFKSFLTFAVVAIMLQACSKTDNGTGEDGPVPVRFSTPIATRAAGDLWAAGDRIGVRMLDAQNAVVSGYTNVSYEAASSGLSTGFSAVAGDMYYPMDGSAVKFTAYYPYTDIAGNIYPVDVSDQSDPAAIDLLWTSTALSYSKTVPNVTLPFVHKLSKLVIETDAAANVGVASLAGMTVTIKGMNTSADFNVQTGALSGEGTPADITPLTVTEGEQYEAIILPAGNSAGTLTVEFLVNGETYKWKVPATAVFEAGKEHTWEITLTRTGVDAVQGTIKDWEIGVDGVDVAN